jgi:hypothetical protein
MPASDQARDTATSDSSFFLFVGAYLGALGGIRLVQVAPYARGYVVEDFPEWLLLYLTILVGTLLLAGASLLIGGVALRRRARWSRPVLQLGASAFLTATLAHATFLILVEHAYADGGMIWGVLHLLTLTRLPTTGSISGIAGYKLGLGLGIACWLGLAAACLRLAATTRLPARAAPAGEPRPARGDGSPS